MFSEYLLGTRGIAINKLDTVHDLASTLLKKKYSKLLESSICIHPNVTYPENPMDGGAL